jgi:transposase-like protein
MKTSTDIIAGALNCYYGGMSLYNIANNIKQQTDKDFTEVGIKNWINRFTRAALSKTSGLHPNVGPVWIVNECELDVGDKVWYRDVIDMDTSFLLATYLSEDRTMEDASQVLRKAVRTAGKDPETVVTDLLGVYIEGIKNVFGHAVQHITPDNYESSDLSRRKMKHWNLLARRRIDILRRLDSPAKSKLLLNGFMFDHNYLRPRDDLENSAPAEKAGIQSPYKYWTDVITKSWTPVESHAAETLKERPYYFKIDRRNLPDIPQSASEGQTEKEKR